MQEGNTVNIVPVTPITSIDSLQKRKRPQEKILPLHLTDDSKPQWVSCPNPWGDRRTDRHTHLGRAVVTLLDNRGCCD